MERRKSSWTKKLVGLVGALGLTFAMACASTGDTDYGTTRSDEAGAGKTTDPLGPPQHIESDITTEHPSSNTGAGNAASAGSNTNLNQPIPTGQPAQAKVTITETPIEEETMVVETETEPVQTAEVTTIVEDEEEPVRRVTKKE